MNSGFIKLSRQLSDHHLWLDEPFTWGQAWVDLILMAEYKNKTLIVNNEKYAVLRGSFVTSQRKLSHRWKWGIASVNRFLNYLQKTEHQIEHKTEHQFTHITICNYNKFQESTQDKVEHLSEHKAEHEWNTGGTQVETNKEVKEVKEVKKTTTPYPFSEIWAKYPNKDGRKAAERFFKASVKTDQDWKDINTALDNYLQSKPVQNGFIKNGSTWFNNWRDFVVVQPVIIPSPKPKQTGTPEWDCAEKFKGEKDI